MIKHSRLGSEASTVCSTESITVQRLSVIFVCTIPLTLGIIDPLSSWDPLNNFLGGLVWYNSTVVSPSSPFKIAGKEDFARSSRVPSSV